MTPHTFYPRALGADLVIREPDEDVVIHLSHDQLQYALRALGFRRIGDSGGYATLTGEGLALRDECAKACL